MNIRKYDYWEENNNEEMLRRILCFYSNVEGKSMIKDIWITRKNIEST